MKEEEKKQKAAQVVSLEKFDFKVIDLFRNRGVTAEHNGACNSVC